MSERSAVIALCVWWVCACSCATTETESAGGAHEIEGATCHRTMDRVALRVETWDGRITGCSTLPIGATGGTQVLELTGAIVAAQGNSVSIDSCDAGLGCEPQTSTLYVDAPGIDLAGLSAGTGVTLSHRWWPGIAGGCMETVLIVGPENTVYLAASDGNRSAPLGAPFTVEAEPLGCPSEGSGCGDDSEDIADEYLLRFIVAGETHDVFMGQTEEITWTSGSTAETWRVRNLRSFLTGLCDDNWNWAYWTVRVAAP